MREDDPVAAVILAGGRGRRLAGGGHLDKAAVAVEGLTMLDRVLAAAAPLCDPLVVVGPSRPTVIAGVVFVSEAAPGGGPVPAVLAGLDALGSTGAVDTVVVLACDLPLLTDADLLRLVDALDEDPTLGAAAAGDPDGKPNPLLAAYRTFAVHPSRPGPGRGAGEAAAHLLPERVAVVDLGPVATLNVNSPADLVNARELLVRRRS